MRPTLVVGFGTTGHAVASALVRRGGSVVAADDRVTDEHRTVAAALGIELIDAPDRDELDRLVAGAGEVIPAPGLPDHHLVFAAAATYGVPVRSEFDVAARYDDRPFVAVTGTDGKTTVTALVAAMLEASGVRAAAVGNTETPLVTAIDDPTIDVFAVEASSFRLLHSERFAPRAATWLNFAPDHLDNHRTIGDYEAAKAQIWRHQSAADVAIGNADDPVVMGHLATAPARHETFGHGDDADWRVVDGALRAPDGAAFVGVAELPRNFDHDVQNALAAAATAVPAGATLSGCAVALRDFRGLPHRLSLVAEVAGVRWFDSSKATTPHAALNDVAAVGTAVLIAGGRNKGLDLSVLTTAPTVRAVVAIGEAAADVVAAFEGRRPVLVAGSMAEAVAAAATLAQSGDAVVLAPGCASFDWYGSYGERGDDFAAHVLAHLGVNR